MSYSQLASSGKERDGLITSSAFIVIKGSNEFHEKTTAPNQLWQTGFTYLKVIGWGWRSILTTYAFLSSP